MLHGAFQTGTEAAGLKTIKILRAVFQMFHKAPAQRDDYVTATNSTNMALGKNRAVVERAILIWSNMVEMCKF